MFSGFYFILLVLFSSYTQRRTLSSSPCCYSFWRKMLHCITMCCWSTSMRSEIHVKDSFPVLIALRPHPAESSLWGTAVGSPKQAVKFSVFESGTRTCFMPALGVSKRHIRHWFILALQLSQTGVRDSWAPSQWSNAHSNWLCVPCALPQASWHGQTKPPEACRSAPATCI